MDLATILIFIPVVIMLIVAIFRYGYNEGYRDGVNHMEEMYIDRKYERKDGMQNEQS